MFFVPHGKWRFNSDNENFFDDKCYCTDSLAAEFVVSIAKKKKAQAKLKTINIFSRLLQLNRL